MSIATMAAEAVATIRQTSPRARERTLDAEAVAVAIRCHLKHARRLAKSEPHTVVRTVVRGGYVANSYRYRAEADVVTITGRTASSITILAHRGNAQSRSHGNGETCMHRAIKPHQSQGRIL